jgi:multiple antibiotic resistance protein
MKLNSDVTTLIALFAIVNPITAIPVFLAIAKGMSVKERRRLALKTAAIAGLTLFIAYFLGDLILKSLSIQLDAFRIAGSMVIAAFGWKMVTGRGIESDNTPPAGAAIVPLAIPLMAGPGAIATVIALGNSDFGFARLANLFVIVGLTIMTFIFLLAAAPIERVLGDTGLMVVSRILGLLLLAIAVSTVISALTSTFPGLSH